MSDLDRLRERVHEAMERGEFALTSEYRQSALETSEPEPYEHGLGPTFRWASGRSVARRRPLFQFLDDVECACRHGGGYCQVRDFPFDWSSMTDVDGDQAYYLRLIEVSASLANRYPSLIAWARA